ncbi:MAG: DivIVA domain-containing protein [Microbacteriaceae bacterium]
MALTPEDVVNKRFQPTKFREGYDQDEVDDFLDEVVVELRRLNQENEELKQRNVANESRIAELQRSGGGAEAEEAEEADEPAQPAAAQPVAASPVVVAAPAAAVAAPAAAEPSAIDTSATEGTNNLLQLARRLHEEHVRDGVEKRDALIAEGHATAARVVAEAESKQRAQINALDQERTTLEHRIDELRTFERDYREKLRGYIESQLRELDSANTGSDSYSAPAGSVSGNSGSAQTPPTFQGFGS